MHCGARSGLLRRRPAFGIIGTRQVAKTSGARTLSVSDTHRRDQPAVALSGPMHLGRITGEDLIAFQVPPLARSEVLVHLRHILENRNARKGFDDFEHFANLWLHANE